MVSDAIRATLRNPRESAYMARFALATKNASKKRAALEAEGEHIPPFLIASITSSCNLHCSGCYSRCNNATKDTEPVEQLTDDEWLKIFDEADDLGVSFILLAGGEPLLRKGVIEAAGKKQNIFSPEMRKALVGALQQGVDFSTSTPMGELSHARFHHIRT